MLAARYGFVDIRRLALGGLFVFVVGFAVFALAHIFPPAAYGLADDWRVFYAAAHVVQHAGNPYDAATIHAAEQAAQHYATVQPSLDDFTDLPVVARLLQAVTWLPYWVSFAVFTVLGVAASAAVLFVWMRAAGWRRTGLWLLGALCSWPMLLGLFSGQFDALLLGGVVGSVLLMQRDKPGLAGLCMAVVLFKPHLLWPVPLLLCAVWLPHRRRALRFALVSAGVVAVGTIAGFLFVVDASSFFGHAFGFGGRIGAVQPDLSGLAGLLTHVPGRTLLGAVIAVFGAGTVLVLAYFSARSRAVRMLSDGQRAMLPLVGLAVWLACTPYAHPNDDVLLFPLLVLLVGVEGRRISGRWLQYAVLACIAMVSAFLAAPALGYAALVVMAGLLVWERRRMTSDGLTSVALAALMLLPIVWPFHVLDVSLTPVAVSLVAIAGVSRLRAELAEATEQTLPRIPASQASGAALLHA